MREALAFVLVFWLVLSITWPDWAGKEFGDKAGRFVKAFDAAYSAAR